MAEELHEGDRCAGEGFAVVQPGGAVGVAGEDEVVLAVDDAAGTELADPPQLAAGKLLLLAFRLTSIP